MATLPRAAMLLAILSAGVLVGTALGLTATGPLMALYVIHLCLMALLFTLMWRIAQHHSLAHRLPSVRPNPVVIPRLLKILTVVSLVALLSVFVATVRTYGEGFAELRDGRFVWVRGGALVREMSVSEYRLYHVRSLRVFASGWLFFSLTATWVGQVVSIRLRAYRRMSIEMAA